MSRRRAGGAPRWVDAPGEGGGQHADWDAVGTLGGSTRAQAAASVALRYGLWGGIVLALLLGLVNCAAFPTAALPPAATPAPPEPVAPPGGCAELVVAAWLAGDVDVLAGVPGLPRGQPEPGRRQALRTYTASVTPGEAAWGYVIGAEVRAREDAEAPWQPVGHQFFAVTMVPSTEGCQGWAPAALPAQVAPPVLAGPPLPYPVTLPATGTELSETLAAFFAAMLAGVGSPERYVAPGTVVPVLSPPPYQQVSVVELRTREDAPVDRSAEVPADGTVVSVLVTVATDPDDLPLVYPVTVGVRGGRWEVLAMEPLVQGG